MLELKPMLASPAPAKINFPVFASAKLDGIRALINNDGIVVSRTLKPIPNLYVQSQLGYANLTGLDGELIVGDANHKNAMQTTTSGVMTIKGEPDFTFWLFDFWNNPDMPFGERLRIMERASKDGVFNQTRVKLLRQVLIHNQAELNAFEAECLGRGYEGIMIRDPKARYKYGRATPLQGNLLKVKRFEDGEAEIVGAEEFMHNANEAFYDNLGNLTRTSHQENKVPMNKLGALVVKDLVTGITFKIGTGFDDNLRINLWELFKSGKLVGLIVKYKHFANAGVKDAPRFPVFIGFRDPRDM